MRANPAINTVLQSPPSQIHLWFTEDLNAQASRIVVWDRNRQSVTLGDAIVVPGHPDEMEVRLQPYLPRGSYVVLWTSVSAQDGHVLHGYYSFGVKVMGPGPSLTGVTPSSASSSSLSLPNVAAILAHWIELLAAISWAGMAAFSALLFSEAARYLHADLVQAERERLLHLLQRSLAALALAGCVVVTLQVYALTNGNWTSLLSPALWSSTFASSYGAIWLVRQAVLGVTLLTTVLLAATPRLIVSPALGASAARAPLWKQPMTMPMLLGFLYLYLMAASGHAAAVNIGELAHNPIFSLSVFIDWLHYVAVALWFGGQIYIVLVLIPTLRIGNSSLYTLRVFLSTLNWFSPIAYASVAFFTFSGAFVGKVHIASWDAFISSLYGQALMVKLVLVGLMMLTSMMTVYVVRPELSRHLWPVPDEARVRALTRQLVAELHINPILGVGVLLATSVMFYYPIVPSLAQSSMKMSMPAGMSAVRMAPHVDTLATAAYNVTLSLSPNSSGLNQLTVTLRNKQRRLVQQANVIAQTSLPAMNTGASLAPLHEIAPGVFRGRADLSLAGRWQIKLLIYSPSGLSTLHGTVTVGS